MESKKERAVKKFIEGYNCAQSVLFSFREDLGIDDDLALKIASGFGGGMGGRQEVCGAVSGAIMVIGLKYGRGSNDDRAAKETAYAKTKEVMERFSEIHGTYICRQLLDGCDLMTEEGRRLFREQDLSNKTCKVCVASAVKILEEILWDRCQE
jgi:C_GCAxxG_C_C family probable redox protein